jgi:hypothetical protein
MAGLGGVLTRGTGRLVGEPLKGLRGVGTCLDRLGWRGRRQARRGSTLWPHPRQEHAEAEQSEEQECAEEQLVSHVVPLP